jgi:hypothetical protein
MIDPPCREAGEMTTMFLAGDFGLGVEEAKQVIAAKHQECKGGTWCDCQHKIEKVIDEGCIQSAG